VLLIWSPNYNTTSSMEHLSNFWFLNLIFIDFIKKLSSTSNYDIILVTIDWLYKQAIFFLIVDTITLHELAKLFVIYIFSKHSVLSHITSNQGSKFVSSFLWSSGTALDIKLYFTFRYHFKEDVQTKYTNYYNSKTLEWIKEKESCIRCYKRTQWSF